MIFNTSYNPVTAIASTLASIGAINWGLIGMFNFNLVTYLLGEASTLTKIVYILVGISGLYSIICLTKIFAGPSVTNTR